MNKSRIVFSVVSLILSLFLGCSDQAGGTTTETTNGIMLTLVDTNGSAVVSSEVTLRPYNYIQNSSDTFEIGAIQTRVSDTNGIVLFEAPPVGEYRIIALGKDSLLGSMIASYDVTSHKGKSDTATVEIDTMEATGLLSLDLSVERPTNIALFGSEFTVAVDSATTVIPSFIPAGLHELHLSFTDDRVLEVPIALESSDTALIDSALLAPYWKQKKVVINTTPEELDLTLDVTLYPFRVGLDESDSALLKAVADGRNLMITAGDERLKYIVETWSKTEATLWVQVPHIAANKATQYITIHYGDLFTTNVHFDNTIFSGDIGYIAAIQGDLIDDSVVNECGPLSSLSSVNITPVKGHLGKALSFDGSSSYASKLLDNNNALGGNHRVTLQCWMNPLNDSGNVLDIRSINRAILLYLDEGSVVLEYKNKDGKNVTSSVGTTEKISTDIWSHVAVTIDFATDEVIIFLNGDAVPTKSQAVSKDLTPLIDDDFQCIVGKSAQGDRYFSGLLDEIRIYRGVWGENWTKLDYTSQK